MGKESTRPKRWRSAGHEGDVLPVQGPRAIACVTSSPPSVTVPPVRLAQARDGLDQLVLAVAGDAGDAQDLARAHLEADAIDDLAAAVVAARAGPPTCEHDLARMALRRGRRSAGPRGRPSARPGRPRSSRLGMRLPTTLPRRMTVMRSAISSTS